ncbi:phage tail protein [Flavobacterium sp.]|uniref:phage tail protein n=1 Tax=Flavobacterium sp. TaxID=239 RepID=UPI003752E654
MKNKYYLIIIFFLLAKSIFAQDQFVGEVRLFPTNFAPIGWAKCEGQLLSISQNTALFSLLGTTYGGNGQTTFALPDLRGSMAIQPGQGPGLSLIYLGQMDGTSTLATENLPAHNHVAPIKVSSSAATSSVPSASSSLAAPLQMFNGVSRPVAGYNTAVPNITLSNVTTSTTGSSTPVSTQPCLALTYCIALQGIFPPRN